MALFDIPLFVVASALAALGPRVAGSRAAAWIATGWTLAVTIGLAVYATVSGEAGWGVLLMAAAAGASLLALGVVLLGRVPTEWIASGPFAFRLAPVRAAVATHVLATFVQIVVFWGFFLAAVPLVVRWLEQRWGVGAPLEGVAAVTLSVFGIVVLVLASALGIWAAISMSVLGDGTPLPAAQTRRLVIAGPYVWVRNPMAMAGIVQAVAVGLILGSWLVVAYALVGSLLWNYAVRPLEESDLELRFGAEYARYRDAVWCWVPRPRRPYPTTA
jgi:protein-S-isoprenylcysteine O-methyltransferase Ste14